MCQKSAEIINIFCLISDPQKITVHVCFSYWKNKIAGLLMINQHYMKYVNLTIAPSLMSIGTTFADKWDWNIKKIKRARILPSNGMQLNKWIQIMSVRQSRANEAKLKPEETWLTFLLTKIKSITPAAAAKHFPNIKNKVLRSDSFFLKNIVQN